tara:strand:- start:59 stop:472 length:414 start_codon:yes stop_codon:yes gene_type:complete
MEDKQLNKGALFNALDQKIFKGGKINVNGDEQKFLVAQSKNKEGKDIYPLYQQVGWMNINTKKTEEKQPDVYGHFDFNTFRFKVAGWKRQSEKGTNYLSVAVQFDKEESMKNDDFNQTKEKIDKHISDKELNDEVPF